MDNKQPKKRGFAAMDPKLVSDIARKGGQAAHARGTAHEFTTEEARVAGRKGGRATHQKRAGVHAPKLDGAVLSGSSAPDPEPTQPNVNGVPPVLAPSLAGTDPCAEGAPCLAHLLDGEAPIDQ